MEIHFQAVDDIANLKAPPARMRHKRPSNAMQNGTLIDTHGNKFSGTASKIAAIQQKRKKMTWDAFGDGDSEDTSPSQLRKKYMQNSINATEPTCYNTPKPVHPSGSRCSSIRADFTDLISSQGVRSGAPEATSDDSSTIS